MQNKNDQIQTSTNKSWNKSEENNHILEMSAERQPMSSSQSGSQTGAQDLTGGLRDKSARSKEN